MSAQPAPLATCPRTLEGKAISSRNATTHGLSSPRTVLPHEDPAEFDALLTAYQNEFQPEGVRESFLVRQMADAQWKIDRAHAIEAAVFERMMFENDKTNPPATPEAGMAQALLDRGADPLNGLQHYISALERTYHKAHRELLQARKLQNEVARKAAQAELKAQEAQLVAFLNAPLPSTTARPASTRPSPVAAKSAAQTRALLL